jgi:hypothetical protein
LRPEDDMVCGMSLAASFTKAADEKLGGGDNSTLANYPQLPEQQEWLLHGSASTSLAKITVLGEAHTLPHNGDLLLGLVRVMKKAGNTRLFRYLLN